MRVTPTSTARLRPLDPKQVHDFLYVYVLHVKARKPCTPHLQNADFFGGNTNSTYRKKDANLTLVSKTTLAFQNLEVRPKCELRRSPEIWRNKTF